MEQVTKDPGQRPFFRRVGCSLFVPNHVYPTGPMSMALPGDAIGFLRTSASEPIPDVQYHISGIGLHGDYGAFFPKIFGITAEVGEQA